MMSTLEGSENKFGLSVFRVIHMYKHIEQHFKGQGKNSSCRDLTDIG